MAPEGEEPARGEGQTVDRNASWGLTTDWDSRFRNCCCPMPGWRGERIDSGRGLEVFGGGKRSSRLKMTVLRRRKERDSDAVHRFRLSPASAL